jgi:hypothetical protein
MFKAVTRFGKPDCVKHAPERIAVNSSINRVIIPQHPSANRSGLTRGGHAHRLATISHATRPPSGSASISPRRDLSLPLLTASYDGPILPQLPAGGFRTENTACSFETHLPTTSGPKSPRLRGRATDRVMRSSWMNKIRLMSSRV